MDVLEKIFEEIEDHAIEFESFGMCDDYVSVGWAKEIIRSHMDEVENAEIEPVSKEFLKDCAETAKRYKRNIDGWIPVEEGLPEQDNYILLSFDNFSLADIGRYEVDDDGGGAFYPGDEDTSYSSIGFFVNAWRPLPEPYRPKESKSVKNTQQEMEDFWRDK